jgi:lysyl-tRNA synthetase class 2
VVEIGPVFRAREHGAWHRREFTMCEWYRVGATLASSMDEIESLVRAAAAAVHAPDPGPFHRITVRDLFRSVCGIDLAAASSTDLSDADEGWDDAFMRRWVSDIEPSLTGAVLVYEWPASQAALARVVAREDWPVALRYELYLNGIELANAFDELLDGAELRRRFVSANAARIAAGEDPHPMDEALIAAVYPRTVGVALGVDRLVAALVGADGIGAVQVDVFGDAR